MMKIIWFALLFALSLAGASYGQVAVTDALGRLTALRIKGKSVPLSTDLRIFLRNPDREFGLADARDTKVTRKDDLATWRGSIELAPGKRCRFEESLREADGMVNLSVRVTAEADVETEGIYVRLDVPVDAFSGGLAETFRGGAPTEEGWATLTRHQPVTSHFQTADRQWTLLKASMADRIVLTDAEERTRLEAKLNRSAPVVVRDTRETKGTSYSCRILLSPRLRAGQTAALQITLKPTEQPGRTRANLSVNAKKVLYKLDGFGGNYCFNPGTPVTKYTLDHLDSAWARTEMSLEQWVLVEGKVTPTKIDWDYLEAQDKPGFNLRREFLTAQQVQNKRIPYVITVWDIPKWLYADPEKPSYVAKDKWPELASLVGSYLVYAKRTYGVEPDLFSFNEPNAGIRVKMSPADHRAEVKLLGAHFKSLGLKTKILLGDVINMDNPSYVRPAANDREAMPYAGAVAFHSWGRPSRAMYGNWSKAAKELKLPLLVTEVGVDANAHRDRSFAASFHYALAELRQYQELLLYAHPQGLMQWEFTKDYGLVDITTDDKGETTAKSSQRFFFIQHFCNLTPHKADALATRSDVPNILFTAFAGSVSGKQVYTLHVANLSGGTARSAKITGLPAGVASLRSIRTGEKDQRRESKPVAIVDGSVEVDLEPESLLTLTTMP